MLDGGLPEWRASGFDVESSASGDAILKASAAREAVEKVYHGQLVCVLLYNILLEFYHEIKFVGVNHLVPNAIMYCNDRFALLKICTNNMVGPMHEPPAIAGLNRVKFLQSYPKVRRDHFNVSNL